MGDVLYKVLGPGGVPYHGGRGTWYLPRGKRPGKWMPEIADPEPCFRGYHLCRGEGQLLHWLGPEIRWQAELLRAYLDGGAQ